MKSKTKIIRSPKKAIKEIEKLAKSLKGPDLVKVGLPKGSNDYPDGTSVIMVGLVHEFGSPSRNIPQRSFLRSTVASNKREYKDIFKRLGKKIVDGKITKLEALKLLGLKVQTDVRDKITDIDSPELKSRDGNPLVDTGHLRQSITYEVDE
jgi:phage gpG-like protein